MRTTISRVLALFRRPRLDRDLEAELRAHLEMAAEENRRRGMNEDEARAKALRDFGGVTQVRETVRVREGPFADFHGEIAEIKEDQLKLKVLVNIFGRETPVELEFAQVAKL